MRAIDYAYGYQSGLAAKLRSAHVATVMRYVGDSGNPKCLERVEASGLQQEGIGLGFVYEGAASWMLQGRAAGIIAAGAARRHIRDLGGPQEPFVYFACDFDARPGQLPEVLACLRGAASVLGADKVGIYGGLAVVTAALKAQAAVRAWQTRAWSTDAQGEVVWHPGACLRQVGGEAYGSLRGLSYDADEQVIDDVGQWVDLKPASKPTPPEPASKPTPPPREPLPIVSGNAWSRIWRRLCSWVRGRVQ